MTRSYIEYAQDMQGAAAGGLRKEVQALSQRFAKDAQKGAKLRALRRFRSGTGNLRRSIKGLPALGRVNLGFKLSAGGPRVPYAAIQEFGGKAGRNRSVTIRGRRYLRDTIAVMRKRLPPALSKALRTAVGTE